LQYGPAFQGLRDVARGERQAVGRVDGEGQGGGRYLVHPAVLDRCFHLLGAAFGAEAGGGNLLPVAGRSGRLVERPARGVVAYGGTRTLEGDVYLLDDYGRVRVEVQGLRLRQLGGPSGPAAEGAEGPSRGSLYEVAWQELEPLPLPAGGAVPPRQGSWLLFLD